jgi:hypothetical protein
MTRKLTFYPLFRITLVQMIRYGEINQAIELAGREACLAIKHSKAVAGGGRSGSGGAAGGTGGSSGILMVPIPSRARMMGFDPNFPDTPKVSQFDKENDDGPRP